MKSIAIFLAQIIIVIPMMLLLAYAGLSPLEHWQWWAWFLPMLACILIHDIGMYLGGKK